LSANRGRASGLTKLLDHHLLVGVKDAGKPVFDLIDPSFLLLAGPVNICRFTDPNFGQLPQYRRFPQRQYAIQLAQ
jgi:hypothetical protein